MPGRRRLEVKFNPSLELIRVNTSACTKGEGREGGGETHLVEVVLVMTNWSLTCSLTGQAPSPKSNQAPPLTAGEQGENSKHIRRKILGKWRGIIYSRLCELYLVRASALWLQVNRGRAC